MIVCNRRTMEMITTNPDTTTKPYRPCVGLALFNNKGEVFVGERIDTPGAWQMPQGGIDPGEDIKKAAMREMKEEIGTDKAEIIRIAEHTVKYDLPEEIAKNLWDGKYCGQEQTWIALRFTGNDKDININSHDYPEFTNWQWVPFKEMLEHIVPFKRDVYEKVINMFNNIPSKF